MGDNARLCTVEPSLWVKEFLPSWHRQCLTHGATNEGSSSHWISAFLEQLDQQASV